MGKKGDTLTEKQDLFARYLFQGLTQREAWGRAGYSTKYLPSIIDSNACRLASKVKARVAELKAKADSEAIADVIERKKVLTEIVRGRVNQYVSGNRINATVNNLNSAAISEVVTQEVQIGKGDAAAIVDITRLKLRDPVGAISELNRMERIYEEKPSQTTNQIIFVCRNEDTKELLRGLMRGERYVKDSEAQQIEGEVIDKA